MTSPVVFLRALLVASTAFALVSADHDLNMQCVAKMKPVAIDTEDENGGVARTSFLYVEVEADQTITVEPEACPDGTIPPMRVYEFEYAADRDYCQESWGDEYSSVTFDCEYEEEVPDDYDVVLDNPAKYSCMKVTETHTYSAGDSNTHTRVDCMIHESDWSDNVCCPAEKSTLIMRQPTQEEWMNSYDTSPVVTLGRCTAARFTELYGNDVDLTAVPFDTSDREPAVSSVRMDGQDGRDGPYTIKEVYKKLGDRAKTVLRHSFWPNLMAPDTVVKVTGVADFTETEITAFFDAQEVGWSDCNGDDCFDRQETVGSMGGTTFLGFDADDPDAAEVDFPGLEEWQVNMFLSHFVHSSSWCWECEQSEIASKISVRYKNCNAALNFPPTLGIPPLARDNIAGYFTNFHKDPVPGNNQIRSDMKLTGFKSAVSKKISDTCKMLVTLVDVPTLVDPQELVSIDGVAFSDLLSVYDGVPDAYVALDAFTVLARTTGKVPRSGKKFTVEVRDTVTGASTTYTNITATTGAYSSLKRKLDARNDMRWDRNFQCGGMDFDRTRGKIKLVDAVFTRDSAYDVSAHVDLSVLPGGRDEAIDSMKDSSLSFAFYLGSRSLETGQTSYAFQHENELWGGPDLTELTVADFEGCMLMVDSCYGDGGGIPLTPAENVCSYEKLAEVVEALNATMEKTETGTVLTDYVDYLQHMGTDAWVDCISIVTNSMEDAWVEETQETTECVVADPCDWMTMDHSDETLVEACNHGSWGYCADHPEHAWCADPCCNWDMQQTMCCAPKDATVSVFRPKLKTESYVKECISAAFENSKTTEFPSGDLESLKCVDPTEATAAADFIAGKLQNPKACMSKYLEVNKIVTEINSDLECCLGAVVGVESWDNGYSMKSTQPCESDDQCESGKCLIAGANTVKDTPMDDGCAWSTATLTNRCAMTGSDASGAAIARCLNRRLKANTKVTDEVVATVKKVLGGSSNATDADVGQTITDSAISQTCMGDGDAWKYDANCWGSECSDCEGDTECKAACVGAEACNWKPRSHNETACTLGDWENCWALTTEAVCEATSGDFCLGKTEWGSTEDLTEASFCRLSAPSYYGKYDDSNTWETEDYWRHESVNINDTVCSGIDTDIGAGGLAATAVPWEKQSSDPAKMCTFSGTGMSSVKATCLDACTGSTNGFQPAARYQCYVEPESATGKCPTTGYFTRQEEDWNFHAPEGVSRPTFCIADYDALKEQYGEPDLNDSLTGTAQTNEGWRVTLAGDGSNGGVTAGTYNRVGTEWQAITGFSRREEFDFATLAQAEKVCTDSGVGASVRVVNDGSGECYEDRCWFDTTGGNAVTSEAACSSKTKAASGTTDGFWAQWRPEMGGSGVNGICSFTRHDIRTDTNDWSATYEPWTVGATATKNFKNLCDLESGTTFYVGREFRAAIMDTQATCDAEYCNIIGKQQQVDNATCTSLGGVCKTQGLGCGGCRAPFSGEVSSPLSGMCYKSGVLDANKAAQCTDLGGIYSEDALQLCRFDDITVSSECRSPNKWITCETIDDAVCGAATADTTTLHGYASNYLNCKATKDKTFCKTAEQCATETGSCSNWWGPQLKAEICLWNETSYTRACTTYSHVCVTTKDKVSGQCPGHTCVGNPDAMEYTFDVFDAFGNRTEVTETHCWDEKRAEVNHDQCADYYIASEADCDDAGGEWWSTDITSQQTFCTSAKTCVGGRTEMGWTGERDAEQCTLCSGRMVSENTWVPGTWVAPAMVPSGNTWQARAYEAGVNSWGARIDYWRVQDLLASVELSLKEEAYSVFTRCQYGQVGESLEQLAGVCSGLDLAARTKVLDKASKLLNNMTAFNGTDMTIGNPGDTNLRPSANSTDGDASYSVDTAIVRVPTDNETLAAVCLGTFSSDDASAVADASNAGRRRTARRRLTQAEAEDASLQDVGCWSRVRNEDDVLVGQLLGECVEVSLGTGQQLLDGVRACLKTKPERPFGDGYTADAFAKRTTVAGVDKYTPVSIPIERVGSQLCGKITDVGAFFCPARVVANWETATVDVGSTECPIVDVIAAAKEAAIRAIRDSLSANEDDGPIKGLDEASGIAVLAAAALLACCCGAGARWCWVRRRRRQKQAASGKANAVPAANNYALPAAQP